MKRGPSGNNEQVTGRRRQRSWGRDGQGDLPFDPYQVLGVPPTAPPEKVTEAYRRRAQTLHPDRYAMAAEDVRLEAERRMKELNRAYRLVKDRGPVSLPEGGASTGVPPQTAAVWLGTAPGSWARTARRMGSQAPRTEAEMRAAQEQAARAAREHQLQARVARDMRAQAQQSARYGEAQGRPKPRAAPRSTPKVITGLGQALHTNEIRCSGCKFILRLPRGWQDRLEDTNFFCSHCDRLILSR